MNRAMFDNLAGNTLLQVADDGKAHAGRVCAFRKLSRTGGSAAVVIDGKVRYVAIERLARYGK